VHRTCDFWTTLDEKCPKKYTVAFSKKNINLNSRVTHFSFCLHIGEKKREEERREEKKRVLSEKRSV
jgi:hypothetical protein